MITNIVFGYRFSEGSIVEDENKGKQVRALYLHYLNGDTLVNAAEKAGIESRNHSLIGKILSNPCYLGEGLYPKIIEPDLWEQVQVLRKERNRRLGYDKRQKIQNAVSSQVKVTYMLGDTDGMKALDKKIKNEKDKTALPGLIARKAEQIYENIHTEEVVENE